MDFFIQAMDLFSCEISQIFNNIFFNSTTPPVAGSKDCYKL